MGVGRRVRGVWPRSVQGRVVARERTYPSDLTEEQWEIIEPMLPLIKEPGRPPKHPFRDLVDAILSIDRAGCSWRQLPADFPPWETCYGWFRRWQARGVTDRILDELRETSTGVSVSSSPTPSACSSPPPSQLPRGRTATARKRPAVGVSGHADPACVRR